MLIVLIGYMGSGKSTVGRLLAETLGLPFLDFDSHIESRLGASIPEIFEDRGELYFRKAEHRLLKELLETNPAGILSLGGGTPCYAGNMDLILAHTDSVFYLQLTVGELAARLQGEKKERPLIAHLSDDELPEFIGKHLFERAPFYTRAPYVLSCKAKTPEVIAGQIRELVSV